MNSSAMNCCIPGHGNDMKCQVKNSYICGKRLWCSTLWPLPMMSPPLTTSLLEDVSTNVVPFINESINRLLSSSTRLAFFLQVKGSNANLSQLTRTQAGVTEEKPEGYSMFLNLQPCRTSPSLGLYRLWCVFSLQIIFTVFGFNCEFKWKTKHRSQ